MFKKWKTWFILTLRILALTLSLFGFYCVVVLSLIISEEYPNEVFWVSLIGFVVFGSIYFAMTFSKFSKKTRIQPKKQQCE